MTRFDDLQSRIAQIGLEHHGKTILENARRNAPFITKTIREIGPDLRPALIISAGPSLYRQRILSRIRGFNGTIVASDGAYIQCLKAGIRPDWVVTIDPHPTRIVRWFGDPNYEEHHDEYWETQDLDRAFRNNSTAENAENIKLVDRFPAKLVICTTAPETVVSRTAAMDRYFFTPIVDPPAVGSLTAQLVGITKTPALNTGGTVGTACVLFASTILGSQDVAIVGADLGYYADTPLQETQEWLLLKDEPNIEELYPRVVGVGGVECYTSPTYFYYRQNLLDLLTANGDHLTNCSGHGILFGDSVTVKSIEEWMDDQTGTNRGAGDRGFLVSRR